MPAQSKIDQVKDVTDKLTAAKSAALIQYQGLTALDISDLRDKVRASGGRIEVIKNRLITLALKNLNIELPETLTGPTAIAFSNDDEISPLKEIDKVKPEDLTAHFVFDLFQSYGFPYEVSEELAKKKGVELNKAEFDKVFDAHKQGSRTASAGMFKGGLADHSEVTTKLHTATHLLHKALRTVLGTEVHQAGSNITPERLRFDYTYAGKPTSEQLKEIESMINDKIKEDLPVTKRIEDKKEAIASGAVAFFAEKYPDKVSVYIIGKNPDKDWYSKELCGGPHVEHTGAIGGVTIFKDESLGSGTRRIYAKIVGESKKL